MWFKKKKPSYQVTVAPFLDEWNATDSNYTKTFMDSATGKKLVAQQEAAIHKMALDARARTDFHDGIRVGMVLCLEALTAAGHVEEEVQVQENAYLLNSDILK